MYEDYKKTLRAFFSDKKARSGIKRDFSRATDISPSFLSQVLTHQSHLSTEQGFKASQFMGFTPVEIEFFLLSIQMAKSKDSSLTSFYAKKLKELSRVQPLQMPLKPLPPDGRLQFFSKWYYQAIIELVKVKSQVDESEIEAQLQLHRNEARKAVQFLIDVFLINKNGSYLSPSNVEPPSPISEEERNLFSQSCRLKVLKQDGKGVSLSLIKNDNASLQKSLQQVIFENIHAAFEGQNENLVLIQLDCIRLSRNL